MHAGLTDTRRYRGLLSSGRVDGLLVDVHVSDAVLAELVTGTASPVVVIGRSTDVPGVAWVRADEEGGAYAPTRHLIDFGHTNIGLVSVHSKDHPAVGQPEAGMQRALHEAGLSGQTPTSFGDWTFESGYRLGREMTSSEHRPSALFVLNELMAFGCLQALDAGGISLPEISPLSPSKIRASSSTCGLPLRLSTCRCIASRDELQRCSSLRLLAVKEAPGRRSAPTL